MQNNNDHIVRVDTHSPTQCDKQIAQNVIEYQKRVDDIILWLFEKEKELMNRPTNLEDLNFDQLLNEYNVHEKILTDFYSYSGSEIMRCKEDGDKLRDNLIGEDYDEIGLQMDKMHVCYVKFNSLASGRQDTLKRIIGDRQSKKIEQFEEWLLTMEKKIYCHNNIGPDCNSVQRQLAEMYQFRDILQQKQQHLEFMSNVILFDDADTESKLEDINHRWENICKFVNDRTSDLQKAKIAWDSLEDERPKLLDCLKRIQDNITDLSNSATSKCDELNNESYIKKLNCRSDKINDDIKRIQTLYTNLEQRTRMAIDSIDDKDSLFLIEKALEDIQYNWNTMMNAKRMLDYQLETITKPSLNNLIFMTDPGKEPSKNQIGLSDHLQSTSNHHNGEPAFDTSFKNSSSSSNDDEKESSLQVYSSISCPLPLDESSPSLKLGVDLKGSDIDISSDSQDEFSTTSMTASYPVNNIINNQKHQQFDDACNRVIENVNLHNNHIQEHGYNGFQGRDTSQHNCRVEEWRQSLDSFSSWLKRIEASLGIDETILDLNNDTSIQCWSQSDPHEQLLTIIDIEKQINSGSQEEYLCLIAQGQQIIADLIPEIDGNAYEANLKEIISDIEMRFNSVKRCLQDRKSDLSDKTRWLDLSRKLKSSSAILIEEMSHIVPESDIGVDLITLAQQQDELIRSKSNLDDNITVQSSIQDANLFLKMCETLQQQISHLQSYETMIPNKNDVIHQSDGSSLNEMWLFLRDMKGDIEIQLDRLTLHYTELSQLIEDRLERLDEVHKEMHALQHSMQELSRQLQVAEILRSNWGPLVDLPVEQLSEQLEDLKLFRERISDISSTHELMNSIVDWMTQSDVPLSEQNLKRISELNTIWSLIQVSTEERQKQIEVTFDNLGSSEQKFLTQTLHDLPNWDRRVAASKVPYFVETTSNNTKWDHPKFSDMLKSLNSVQHVIFSAYRTALKLRIVQKTLGIDLMMLDSLKQIFTSFNFNNQSDNQSRASVSTAFNNDNLVDVETVIYLLKVIYEKIQTEEKSRLDVPLSIDLTLNWLLNLYDSTRTGYISALSLKIGLAILSCATREEKYNYMYDLIANPQTQGVDGRRLGTLFEICMRIPIYLGEGASFGGTEIIETNIRECFAKSKFNPDQPNCIHRDDYCNWLKTEPQFIIWLPVLHRILVSEHIKHPVKCKLCKAHPLIGLRYRCLKCFNFNICQNCFLTGRHINEHPNPNTHSMQEYCCPTGSSTKVRDFGKILKNKLTPSK